MHPSWLAVADDPQVGEWIRRLQSERPVGTVMVVVGDVDPEHLLEVSSPANQQPVQALGPHRADPALGGTRLTAASRARSAGSNLGREIWRRSTPSWWRSTRISKSLAASPRASNTSSWTDRHSARYASLKTTGQPPRVDVGSTLPSPASIRTSSSEAPHASAHPAPPRRGEQVGTVRVREHLGPVRGHEREKCTRRHRVTGLRRRVQKLPIRPLEACRRPTSANTRGMITPSRRHCRGHDENIRAAVIIPVCLWVF